MKSLLHLLHLCLLLPGTHTVDYEVFAATGEITVLPLYTRLENTGGYVCNGYSWIYKGSGRFLQTLAEVSDVCRRLDCTNTSRPHCSLTTNGSLQLHSVNAADAGQYTVTTYHLSRARNTVDTINLYVLDAVSQPVVHLRCLADNQTVVSCRAVNGTSVSTSITANGEVLLERSGGEADVFKVSSLPPWNISCSITNKVSQKTTNIHYKMCPEPLSDPGLVVLCPQGGSVQIFCKIENGSDPSFSWNVDGNPVQSSSPWKVLDNLLSGSPVFPVNVSCSVRNSISSVHSPVTTVSCPDAAPHRIFHVLCKVLVFILYSILLISMIRDIWICRKDKP